MRVLAFDPGYGRTGWGVVEESERDAARLVGVAYGVLETKPGGVMADRMADLYAQAEAVVREQAPDHVIMESLFFSKNPTTAAGVYQAQGVLLAVAGASGRPIYEIGPGTIKQVIAGSGRAKKAEVTRMVERLLGFREPIRPDDAADALAGAVAGIYHARSGRLVEAALASGQGVLDASAAPGQIPGTDTATPAGPGNPAEAAAPGVRRATRSVSAADFMNELAQQKSKSTRQGGGSYRRNAGQGTHLRPQEEPLSGTPEGTHE